MLAWRSCVDTVCCWGGQVHIATDFTADTDTNIATDNATIAHSVAHTTNHAYTCTHTDHDACGLCWVVVGLW